MPRVDAHQHFWSVARGDYFWLSPASGPLYRDFGPEDLAPLREAAGIESTVLVQAAQTEAETHFMLDIAARTTWIAGVVGWTDFEAPDAPDRIAALVAHPKLVGLRPMIQDIPDDAWMLKPELAPAFRSLQQAELAFDALVYPRHLGNLLQLLGRYPDLRVVIDHCAKPQIRDGAFEPWATEMSRLARETGALCKLSGLVTEAAPNWTVGDLKPYVDHVLEAFGPRRLIWGSDWPVATLASSYGDWLSAAETLTGDLAPAERQAVFGANAVRFYRLDAPGRLAARRSSAR